MEQLSYSQMDRQNLRLWHLKSKFVVSPCWHKCWSEIQGIKKFIRDPKVWRWKSHTEISNCTPKSAHPKLGTPMRTKQLANQIRVRVDRTANMCCTVCKQFTYRLQRTKISRYFCANIKGIACTMCPVFASGSQKINLLCVSSTNCLRTICEPLDRMCVSAFRDFQSPPWSNISDNRSPNPPHQNKLWTCHSSPMLFV